MVVRRIHRVGQARQKMHRPVDAFRRNRIGVTQRRPGASGQPVRVIREPRLAKPPQGTDEHLHQLAVHLCNGNITGRRA